VPAKPKTSHTDIIRAALELINEAGADELSMLAVAEKVGVRGPSLYKHFEDRAALLRAVETHLFEALGTELTEAAEKGSSSAKQMAFTYRAFAKRNPQAYALMFVSALPEDEALAANQAAAKPVMEALYGLLGDADATLSAARALTAFCHGFVSMELAGAFRLGGDIEKAFTEGVETVLAGITVRAKNSG
jgi:AcrR family transcriptional regulator